MKVVVRPEWDRQGRGTREETQEGGSGEMAQT